MKILINPMNESTAAAKPAAPRLDSLDGKRVVLLDISKPGGSVLLDRLEHHLRHRYQVAEVIREKKPTFAKPAPGSMIDRILAARPHAVIEGLAD
ncbi:MAG: hypothetical protein HYZ37_00245 [Candidatus Solibacter usitatus]|nr:hypothetical protein [Candidatus Solibacter usitatus]